MRARSIVVAACFVVSFGALSIVRARVALADPSALPAPSVPPTEAKSTRPPWTIATGFGYVPMLGGLGAIAVPLGGFITVERTLAGPLSLMARFSGTVGYSSSEAPHTGAAAPTTSTTALARGGIGFKLSAGTREVIEVSPFLLVDGLHGYASSTQYASSSSGIGGELGLTLDRDLLPGFGLRLSAVVLSASHAWSSDTYRPRPDEPDTETTRSESTSVDLTFAPAAELRWSF